MFKVNKDLCIGCGACEGICPSGACVLEDGVSSIDPNLCIRCGACQATCPVEAISEVEDEEATAGSEDGSEPIKILHFFADWCGPCKQMDPELEEFKKFNEHIEVEDINVDQDPDKAGEYGVMSIPTLVFLVNEKEMCRNVGFAGKTLIEAKVKEALNIFEKNKN